VVYEVEAGPTAQAGVRPRAIVRTLQRAAQTVVYHWHYVEALSAGQADSFGIAGGAASEELAAAVLGYT
jgi:hypothetical protein